MTPGRFGQKRKCVDAPETYGNEENQEEAFGTPKSESESSPPSPSAIDAIVLQKFQAAICKLDSKLSTMVLWLFVQLEPLNAPMPSERNMKAL